MSAAALVRVLRKGTCRAAGPQVVGPFTVGRMSGVAVLSLAGVDVGEEISKGVHEMGRLGRNLKRSCSGCSCLRVRNAAGNHLDALGNPGSRATMHLPLSNR